MSDEELRVQSVLSVGKHESLKRVITKEDVQFFARATGDFNPLHLDEEYARKTPFRGRIVHGLLTAGLISALLGNKLPGPGTVYLSQTLRFLSPVRIGDEITATVEIKSIEERRIILKTTCTNHNGTVVLSGEAEVLIPRTAKSSRNL